MNRDATAGFTLLEVLVALAVLAIVVTSVFQLHATTLGLVERSRTATRAPRLADGVLTRIARELPEPDTLNGTLDESDGGWTWQATVTPIDKLVAEESKVRLYRVSATVFFNGDAEWTGVRVCVLP